jgi:hypothetical protein
MTSLQCQYLLCPPLVCSTAQTHQQPKIVTSGYLLRQCKGLWWVRSRFQRDGLWLSVPIFVGDQGHLMLFRWDLQNWGRVWFSDESRFMLQTRDGCTRVYRRRNERFARNCVLEVDNFGDLMLFLLLSRSGFSGEVLGSSDLGMLMWSLVGNNVDGQLLNWIAGTVARVWKSWSGEHYQV